MLTQADSYDEVYRSLKWQVPEFFNMGVEVCDRQADADPGLTALIYENSNGDITQYSFQALKLLSNKLANLFQAKGLKPGGRVGILLPQSVETGIAHVAAWKAGLISIPLFTLFGPDALQFRLKDSGARALVTDIENLGKIESIRDTLPDLDVVLVNDAEKNGVGMVDFWSTLESASDTFTPLRTRAEDPSFISYTSGTTGNPKGTLHAHRTLLGHLGVVGRVTLLRIKHHHDRALLGAAVEIDNILVGQADAARRDRCADIFRLVGAVNAEQGVAVALIEIERAGAERIVRTAGH